MSLVQVSHCLFDGTKVATIWLSLHDLYIVSTWRDIHALKQGRQHETATQNIGHEIPLDDLNLVEGRSPFRAETQQRRMVAQCMGGFSKERLKQR